MSLIARSGNVLSDKNKYIHLDIPTLAVAKARPRLGKGGHVFTPAKTKSFEAELRWHWKKSGNEMIPQVPTQLAISIFLPKPKKPKCEEPIVRPDLDNFAKAVMDGLNGFAWKDDSQITTLFVSKQYTEKSPSILLVIAYGGEKE